MTPASAPAVSLLGAAQNEDGGWSWTGRGGRSDRYATSRAVWALSLSRKAGYHVPEEPFHKAVAWLQNEFVATAEGDYETKAILLHALATVGKADFAVANRLYRERQRLSAGAMVYLSLALAEMDRKPTAGEVLDWMDCGAGVSPAHAAETAAPRNAALAPVAGRVARALGAGRPGGFAQSPKAKELVDWLLAHRVGHRWSPDKATGPATLALAQWFAQSRFEGEKYTLAVFVNNVLVQAAGGRSGGRHAVDRRAPRAAQERKARSGSVSRSPAAGDTPTSASWAGSCPPKNSAARPRTGKSSGPSSRRRWNSTAATFRAASASFRARIPSSRIRSRNCRWDAAGWSKSTSSGKTCRKTSPSNNWNTLSSPSRFPLGRRSSSRRSAADSSGSRSRRA